MRVLISESDFQSRNPISRILNILSKFLTARTELPDVKLEGFIKCNGVITLKMKLHGSKRIF